VVTLFSQILPAGRDGLLSVGESLVVVLTTMSREAGLTIGPKCIINSETVSPALFTDFNNGSYGLMYTVSAGSQSAVQGSISVQVSCSSLYTLVAA
jgi:hypothetical protein